jgi:ATP-binding cassette subfamily B protein
MACHGRCLDAILVAPLAHGKRVAAIALVVAALAMLGVGQGLRAVIDRGFSAGDPAWLDRALLMMFGIIALLAAATYTRFYNVSWLGERVTADLRRRVFDHLLTLPPSYFEAGRTGAVISRLTSDTTLIENAVGSSLSIALRNLLILIGGLVMLFTTNLKLTLLVLGGVPLVVAPIVLFGRACGASRASARIASPTWATASTRPSTRSASSRPTATKPPTAANSPA